MSQRLTPPYRLARYKLPGRVLIGEELFDDLDSARAEADGLIMFAAFVIEVVVTDSAGVELYNAVVSPAEP